MDYSVADIAIIGCVMTLGSVLQGAVGFASGLFGVPLLVLCGFSLPDATIINFALTSVQNTAGAVHLWSHLEPSELVWPNIFRCLAMPAGVMALAAVDGMPHDRVQQIIGVVLLGSVLLVAGLRVRPRDHVNPLWMMVAFLTSGFLMGLASMGGAPMVMYVNALTWSAAKSRGFLFFCSAVVMPAMAVALAWKFGVAAAHPLIPALIVLPPNILGLWFGLRLGHKLDKRLFRRVTYGLLALVAVGAIGSPWIASFFRYL
jgi:uncharacterized protein